MQWIEQLRERGNRYFLNKAMAHHKHTAHAMNYANARYVGILFDASEPSNIATVKQFAQQLKGNGKNVEVLALFKNKKQVGEQVLDHFTLADTSFFRVPRQGVLGGFANKPFDLLLSLHTNPSLPLEYLSAMSMAKCRVGRYIPNKTICYDLMAFVKDGSDLRELIKQIDDLLNEINKNATV